MKDGTSEKLDHIDSSELKRLITSWEKRAAGKVLEIHKGDSTTLLPVASIASIAHLPSDKLFYNRTDIRTTDGFDDFQLSDHQFGNLQRCDNFSHFVRVTEQICETYDESKKHPMTSYVNLANIQKIDAPFDPATHERHKGWPGNDQKGNIRVRMKIHPSIAKEYPGSNDIMLPPEEADKLAQAWDKHLYAFRMTAL